MIITIDGPAASGKSSMARLLAHEFSLQYLATGLVYRAVGYILVHEYAYTLDMLSMPDSVHIEQVLCTQQLIYRYHEQKEIVVYKGTNLGPVLKGAEVDRYASIISTHSGVRSYLAQYYQNWAKIHSLVTEGRDCGSVVFPEAHIKFFLTAQAVIRAQRWQQEQEQRGNFFTLEKAIAEIQERDTRDMNRAYAPLRVPEGAFIIDNSQLSIATTLAYMKEYIRGRTNTPSL